MNGRLANLPCSFLSLVLPLAAAPAIAQHAEAAHSWSYEGEHGPAHWGEVSPEYSVCRTGKHQSPIDIRGATPAGLPPIVFSYAPSPLRIIDNGHTVQVNYAADSFITVGGRRYDLVQFHFHHPSEERITGQAYRLSVHLVHKDLDGKLAVVAVLLKRGRQNPFIEGLWKHLPADVGQERAPEGATVDLGQLLPANHGYYAFTGSLTTPPCSEDVSWFVLKTPMEISKSEEAVFANKYANNARPVQPLNGRSLRVTK